MNKILVALAALLSIPALGSDNCKDLSAEASLSFDADTLLTTTLLLITKSDIRVLSELALTDLMTLSGSKAREELLTGETQARLLEVLQLKLGTEKFQRILGESALSVTQIVRQRDRDKRSDNEDSKDMLRGWGTLLLPENDRAFSDPMYLINLLRVSGQTGSNFVGRDLVGAKSMFQEAWRKNAGGTSTPEIFVTTGSDANSLVFDIARGKKGSEAKVLMVGGMYVGTRGEAANAKNDSSLKIDPPAVKDFSEAELNDPKNLEKVSRALSNVEAKFSNPDLKIGAILIETIFSNPNPELGALHPAFVKGLRELCDRFRVPLVADEIMTGGGRTGKFFAYQHYENFQPDAITFGKGMQIGGIAVVHRQDGPKMIHGLKDGTTMGAQLEPLLKGAQVLNRIHEDGLVENAAQTGAYLLERLRDIKFQKRGTRDQVYGFGLLIKNPPFEIDVMQHYNRLLPPVSIAKSDVDRIFPLPLPK
jgi:hypothetical protein